MDSRQTRIVLTAMFVVTALWLISPFLLSFRESEFPVSKAPLSFDASEAYRRTQEFVTRHPNRVLGSLESRQSTGYIHDYLEPLGYLLNYIHFDARIARRMQVGRNVLAYKQGRTKEILAVVAHLDTARTTNQGAMDNGSGVGILLELARVFSILPTRKSLLFVFSDGEEWGMLGARDLATTYQERNRIAAVLSLDHVGIGELRSFCLEVTGQLAGFTPPWLRQLARQAAESQGLPVRSPSGFSEYLERSLLISWADQGPFLEAGIPSVNLGSESMDRQREREIYHSARDTIENLKPASIGATGRAAERIVRALDETTSIPLQSSDSFRLWDALFLRSGAMRMLQIILFLPPALTFCFHLRNYCRKVHPIDLCREFLAFLGTVLPFWIAYFLIALARALRLLPTYTLYPATLKDPVLENPAWGILGGIFGAALFAAVVCYILALFSFRDMPKPDFHVSKLVLSAFLLTGIVFSFFYNPYWASLFFVLPAWIWTLIGHSKTLGQRILNRVLILAAGMIYYAVLSIYASRLGMGWNFIWYQVLALSNGLFTRAAYFLATAVIAIGIRHLAVQSHDIKT